MTPKMREFCLYYVKCDSAYQASLEAGYTKHYARGQSAKLLHHPDVIVEIKRLRARMNERADKSATDVVNEYSKIAFTDRVSFLKDDPLRPGEWMYKAPDELTEEQRAVVEKVNLAVREVKGVLPDGSSVTVQRQEYRYLLSDKANALQQMGRHFGIFDDKIKLGLSQSNPFVNASPEQLEKLQTAWAKTMGDPKLITNVEYIEVSDGS